MPADEVQALIVGAGVGGLALAGFLREGGIEPAVIEAGDGWDHADRGVLLAPDGVAVLEELGVAGGVRSAGERPEAWSIRDGDGTVRRRLEHVPGETNPPVAIGRARLHERLREAVPGGSIRMGTTVESLGGERGGVRVEFSDGVVERFDVVVGADGVRSGVRAHLGAGEPTFCGTASWTVRADVDTPPEVTEVWGAGGRVAVFVPAADGALSWLTAAVDAPGERGADPATIRETFGDVEYLLPDLLGAADPDAIRGGDDHRVRTDRWRDGRVVLLGDAAHALHPLSGMGASLALEDARALAEELLCRDDALEARLADYVGRRRSRVRRLRRTASIAGPLTVADASLIARAREAIALRSGLLEATFLAGAGDDGRLSAGW